MIKRILMNLCVICLVVLLSSCVNSELNEKKTHFAPDYSNETSEMIFSTETEVSEAGVDSEFYEETQIPNTAEETIEKTEIPETDDTNETTGERLQEETEPPCETDAAQEFNFWVQDKALLTGFEALQNHKLTYIQYRPNGSVKNEHAIQEALHYTEKHYYYSEYFDGYALMNVYDMIKNEIIGSFTYPFVILDPVYLEVSDCFFMAPCFYGETGELRMMFICYDIANNTPKIIHDVAVTSPRADIEKIDDDTVLFFLYRNESSTVVDTIYLYSISTGTLSVFYESYDADWDDPELTTKNIKLVETFGGKIFVLFDQMVNNTINNYLEVYDITGSILETHELSVLDQYGKSQCRIYDMLCFGDYLYIDYSKSNSSNTLPDYIMLHKNNGVYEPIELKDYSPNKAIYDGLLFEKYILLSSSSKEYNMLVIDVENHSMIPVSFGFEDEYIIYPYNVHCNNVGKLIVIVEEQNNKQQKIYSFE